jgi:hypothetical protein
MRIPAVAGLTTALALALAPAVATAAAPEHDRGADGPFAVDDFCGMSGTATGKFNSVTTDVGADTQFQRGGFTFTFTADATGKSVTLRGDGVDTVQTVVDQQAGTVTITESGAGLPIMIKATNGPVLGLDAGYLALQRTFAYDPTQENGIGDLLSVVVLTEHGPHPGVGSGGGICAAAVPYLLDP